MCVFSQMTSKQASSSSQSTLSYHSTQQTGSDSEADYDDAGNELQKDQPEKG